MRFEDTLELMQSDKWEDRITAEYVQSAVRYRRLERFIEAVESGEKEYDGVLVVLYKQRTAMRNYIECLKFRMREFGVGAPEVILYKKEEFIWQRVEKQ